MKYLLMVVLLFSSSPAGAVRSFVSGGELLQRCETYLSETGSAAQGNVCPGYVAGIFDVHTAFVAWEMMKPMWCVPYDVNSNQLVRIVTKYLQEHPENLHHTAGTLVGDALVGAFPCE